MHRHTPSFMISLLVHVAVLLTIFFTYKLVVSLDKKETQKKVCVSLSCLTSTVKKENHPPKKKIKKKAPKKRKLKKNTKSVPLLPKKIEKVVEAEEIQKVEEKNAVKQEIHEEQAIVETVTSSMEQEKSISDEEEYIDENIQKIAKLLEENLYYPRSARKRGIVGKVVVKFTLLLDARVESVSIISSQSTILSRAAKKTIEDLSGKFPKPKERLSLEIPINYTLSR